MKFNYNKKIALLTAALCAMVNVTLAAKMYFDVPQLTFKQNDEFKLDVYIDTENTSINTLEGRIHFPKDLLSVQAIEDGNSSVTLWVDSPSMESLNVTGSTAFSGIIPGGFRSTHGYLYGVVFKAKKSGIGAISIDDISTVQNVAEGKVEKSEPFKKVLSISTEVGTSTVILTNDERQPENFNPALSRNDEMFGGKYFLVFVTQDKGSGIDHYEVKEGRWGEYKVATSPYVLENQNVDEPIYVKAVDKNNNERVAMIYGNAFVPWYKNELLMGVIILFMLLISFKFRKRK